MYYSTYHHSMQYLSSVHGSTQNYSLGVYMYNYTCVLHASLLPPFLPSVWYVRVQHCQAGWESARPVVVPTQETVDLSSSLIQVCTCTYICTISIRTYIRMHAHSSYVGPALSDLLHIPYFLSAMIHIRTCVHIQGMYVCASLLLVSQWAGSTYIGDSTPPDQGSPAISMKKGK